MVIIFNGDTLDLMKRLQQYSGRNEKDTLDFMLQNFKIMTTENGSEEDTGIDFTTLVPCVYQHIKDVEKERAKEAQYVAWKRRFDAHMKGIELMFESFWPESYNKEHWK